MKQPRLPQHPYFVNIEYELGKNFAKKLNLGLKYLSVHDCYLIHTKEQSYNLRLRVFVIYYSNTMLLLEEECQYEDNEDPKMVQDCHFYFPQKLLHYSLGRNDKSSHGHIL